MHFLDFSGIDAMINLLIKYGLCLDNVDDAGQYPLDLKGGKHVVVAFRP